MLLTLFLGAAIFAPAKTNETGAVAAVRDLCITPASHSVMLDAAKNWALVDKAQLPHFLRATGGVRLDSVRQGNLGGHPAYLTIGHLSGTSFCRIHFRSVEPGIMIERLQAEKVLGSQLGQADFRAPLPSIEKTQAVGWHKSVGRSWRAVHYSFTSGPIRKSGDWQSVEVTRPM